MPPDPKPAPRVVDKTASRRKLLVDRTCRACGAHAVNCHHLVGRGQGGDDVFNNLIPLCGNGSMGCHGALHGTPYTDSRTGRRWTARDVRQAIGLGLRPSEYRYVLEKLSRSPGIAGGEVDYEPGREFLRVQYGVETITVHPFVMRAVAAAIVTPA